ncbi:hypothetical protein [Candidatus Poriferisodalis sp.]|uniref:hypothetical protein n=1 Tax=Candidatus Poriferisodalis sp. TaxID=3101277 RepID=UPI003B02DDD4
MGNNWLREIGEIFEDWKEATAGVAELEAEERDKAIEEYRKAWNELPRPVQVATTYAGCAVLSTAALGAIVKGKPSVAARISQRAGDLGCTIGVDWIDLSIDDGGTGDGGTDDSDTDDDAADDGGTDDSDSNDDNDPPDSDAVTEAEGAAAKARADYQANRSWQNRKALIDAINRLRCLQPKLYICSTSP